MHMLQCEAKHLQKPPLRKAFPFAGQNLATIAFADMVSDAAGSAAGDANLIKAFQATIDKKLGKSNCVDLAMPKQDAVIVNLLYLNHTLN